MYHVTVDSTEEIIPLTDFKEFARITSSVASDEQLMRSLVDGAIKYCEKYTRISIRYKTYERVWQNNTCELYGDWFELRKGQVSEIVSVKKKDLGQGEFSYDLTNLEIINYKQNLYHAS